MCCAPVQEASWSQAVMRKLQEVGLSAAGTELIGGLMRFRQADRITLEDAQQHAWVCTQ